LSFSVLSLTVKKLKPFIFKVFRRICPIYSTTECSLRITGGILTSADLIENFFVPTMKLKYKIKDEKAKTVKKIYEKAKTPYHRLLESDALSEELKNNSENSIIDYLLLN